MPRFNVQHPVTKQWRCFSTIVDDYVTDWMDEEQYQMWRLSQYGQNAGEIRDANLMDYEEAEQKIADRKRWDANGRSGRERDMNLADEIRKQMEKNKGLKLAVGEINNHLSILEGLVRKDIMEQVDEAYQRGLDDAWEAAKKILQMYDFTVFGLGHDGVFESPLNEGQQMTPQEAIEKLKAYEEKQKAEDEIKVGDEVIYNNTIKCLVVRPETDERYASLIDGNGNHHSADHRECKKTGRHFDIASILEDMRCGQ